MSGLVIRNGRVVDPSSGTDAVQDVWIADGRIHLWVGGGVVWDSDAAAEVEESWTKARPLLEAIGSGQPTVAGAPR